MRPINRTPKPDILARKENEWTQKFMNSNKARPDNSKYGHIDIQTGLYSASHNKCYYCERMLLNDPCEIDHFIEVTEDRSLSFEWTNLYLACTNCNDKYPNRDYPVTSVIDPCSTSDTEIEDNLTFISDVMKSKNNSKRSHDTITKYRLATKAINAVRATALLFFYQKLTEANADIIKHRRDYTPEEIEYFKSFGNDDRPFSYMFKLILKNLGL
jgi:hypothetical protein